MKFHNWVLEPSKYLTRDSASILLDVARNRAKAARIEGKKVPIREYFIIHLGLATGLRVMEMAALKCGDLYLENNDRCLLVRRGKGGKKRLVSFYDDFKKHCLEYLTWKESIGESVAPENYLIVSSNTGGQMTTRGIQKVFKRCAHRANLFSQYSIHCLRHTNACILLEASGGNIRFVQKQLGHSRVSTTEIYADILDPVINKTMSNFCI